MSKETKKRIVIICPGRGSYTAENLGYLRNKRTIPGVQDFISDIDERRRQISEPTITELDEKEKFSPSLHTRGEHASCLIYSCSFADYMSIDREKYEIVAICGNSMGWYLTLAFGGALNNIGAFELIQTMGSMMKENIVGGQMIYPVVDENWRVDPRRRQAVEDALLDLQKNNVGSAHISIYLGGYLVIGGEKRALDHLQKILPKDGDYPFQLLNHAAFHTPLLYETSKRAFESIDMSHFSKPKVPLIDGRGVIWSPYATDTHKLYEYTLGPQVYAPYNFTSSLEVTLKEFCPDHLVLLGPGGTLGGAIGQTLVGLGWRDIHSKADFQAMQKSDSPVLLSMGVPEQRQQLI